MATRKKSHNRLSAQLNSQEQKTKPLFKSRPAKASNYLDWFKRYRQEHPNLEVLLYNRESTDQQDHEKHLAVLHRFCKKHGVPVVGEFYENCSGKLWNHNRRALLKAVKKAQSLIRGGRHVAILATSGDRYLRNSYFTSHKNPDAVPTVAEFKKFLRRWDYGVDFLTLLHPNKPWERVRGFQSKWGQRTTGNRGGHPRHNKPGYKKQRRLEKLDRVFELHNEGKSFGEIEKLIDIPKTTVWDWCGNIFNDTVRILYS